MDPVDRDEPAAVMRGLPDSAVREAGETVSAANLSGPAVARAPGDRQPGSCECSSVRQNRSPGRRTTTA